MKKIILLAITFCTIVFFLTAQTTPVITTAKQDAAKLDPRMTRTTPVDSNSDRSSKKHKSKSRHKSTSKKHKKRKASDD